MADQNWGPVNSQTEAGGTATTNDGGAFGTAELRRAMPTSDDQKIVTSATEPINWVNPVPYDYTAYAKNDSGDHKWDSNAKVYEWNGEEGDIGPEFPDLEIELFGQPDKRQDGRGIDFKG